MLSASQIKEYARSLGVLVSGVCSAEEDRELLEILKKRREKFPVSDFEETDLSLRCSPKRLMPEAKSIFVCLFPYYSGAEGSKNISIYASVPDYHQVAGMYLEKIAAFIRQNTPGARCLLACDTSPLVDRWLAYRAGLGFFGKNNLLIHPEYGSYFFIGSLLLDFSLETDVPLSGGCSACGACLSACPGGALSEDFGFDCERCISYLTQKKELTKEQQALVFSQESVYGCDVCQKVCPYNQKVPTTPIEEFRRDILKEFPEEALRLLSNRAFKKEYASYAFSWCSRQTILKNFHS